MASSSYFEANMGPGSVLFNDENHVGQLPNMVNFSENLTETSENGEMSWSNWRVDSYGLVPLATSTEIPLTSPDLALSVQPDFLGTTDAFSSDESATDDQGGSPAPSSPSSDMMMTSSIPSSNLAAFDQHELLDQVADDMEAAVYTTPFEETFELSTSEALSPSHLSPSHQQQDYELDLDHYNEEEEGEEENEEGSEEEEDEEVSTSSETLSSHSQTQQPQQQQQKKGQVKQEYGNSMQTRGVTRQAAANAKNVKMNAQTKRRGRPRTRPLEQTQQPQQPQQTNVQQQQVNVKKRKAEGVMPESMLGTKKLKTNASVPNLLDRVPSSLSDDELQSMSSGDYESYLKAVSSKLSRVELDLAKKQKRRIKNRESAWNSRIRKQDNLNDLEEQVKLLRSENTMLRSETQAIQIQHSSMAQELAFYRRVISEHLPSHLIPPTLSNQYGGGSQPLDGDDDATLEVVTHDKMGTAPTRRKFGKDAAGASLMCLILFALAWGCYNAGSQGGLLVPSSALRASQIPFEASLLQVPPPLTPVSSSSSRSSSHPQHNIQHAKAPSSNLAGRNWLVSMLRDAETARQEAQQQQQEAASSSSSVASSSSSSASIESTSFVNTHDDVVVAPGDLMTQDVLPVASNVDVAASSNGTPAVSAPFTHEWKQNTTYVFCDRLNQVVPPVGAQPPVDTSQPLYLSIWLQPTSLDGSLVPAASKDVLNGDYLVQVSCQIMSVDQLGLMAKSISASS